VDVSVDVAKAGSGSVTVEVRLLPGTADAIEDLRAGLPVADLRQAGWSVVGPRTNAAGTTIVSATHDFSDLGQLPTLMADIAGSGAEEGRPFRLSVTEDKGALDDTFRAAGTIDLRCSLSCFDDPDLAARLGYPLGLPIAELRQLLADGPGAGLTFRFQLALPGRRTSPAMSRAGGSSVLAVAPALGASMPLGASTRSVNVAFLRLLAGTVIAGAVVVSCTAALILRRRRRSRRRRRGGRGPRSDVGKRTSPGSERGAFPVTGGR
jgi:hypothetical protein